MKKGNYEEYRLHSRNSRLIIVNSATKILAIFLRLNMNEVLYLSSLNWSHAVACYDYNLFIL